eukprot:CAMPEP_0197074214 /NCGR_PEP_ID=MMETSP1384-20130603/210996_1 /TAXON_ID=29189 /ORGANISM="Ammonia sp." /LENGTH=304 /DNA_ID=CAMNT_0042513055 /DNA_START=100 /DNA_END=1015 /DNA_ORIENTATION=+
MEASTVTEVVKSPREDELAKLASIVKAAANKIFEQYDEVGTYAHSTLLEEGFDDIDDILDDLRYYNDSNIISITSKKLMYIMNEQDKYKLYQILIQIYQQGVTDVDAIRQEMEEQSVENKETLKSKDKLIDIVVSVVKQLNERLSMTERTIVDKNKVMQLFRNESELTQVSLLTIPSTKFCEKAKKYSIPAAKAKKILNEIRDYFQNQVHQQRATAATQHKQRKEEIMSMEMAQKRREWRVASFKIKCTNNERRRRRSKTEKGRDYVDGDGAETTRMESGVEMSDLLAIRAEVVRWRDPQDIPG